MKDIEELVLRSCLVARIEGISHLGSTLIKLELYDNQIETIDCINNLINLRVLDLSFNSIRSMLPLCGLPEGLENNNSLLNPILPNLEELYLAQNKLRKIEGLQFLTKLRILDLGANRIRLVEGLENNSALESLWLGKNKIEELGYEIDHLTHLRQLDVQNNRLTRLPHLSALTCLEELYLACNNISTIPTGHLPDSITTIDLSTNQLSDLEGLNHCLHLQELWISKSLLQSFDQLDPVKSLTRLECIYLEHSPIAKDFEYRKRLTEMIPSLKQIDATLVNRQH